MVIDFHSHIYPGKIAARAVESIGEFYRIPMACDGTVEGLAASGRKGGIDRFVVFSAAAVPAQVSAINDYIVSAVQERKGKIPSFTGLGTLHRDMEDPAREIGRIAALGLKGIKLHPDMQKFNIDDKKMMDMYAMLEEGRMIAVFHTGDYRYDYSHPARLARVLDAFPRLTAVAAHFGGWSLHDLALEYFRNRSCYLDVSSSIPYIGRQRARELIRIYGAQRILFGSDYPMWDPAACLEEFNALDLGEDERELILSGNALRILGD
ncbi:MAG: amidohydrolase family protein [Treponema sp.]|jgi:predicted TIM-barrel fold metal-dependent hydrolase|nr:amidohydrolase family protein [Treponema sp.]